MDRTGVCENLPEQEQTLAPPDDLSKSNLVSRNVLWHRKFPNFDPIPVSQFVSPERLTEFPYEVLSEEGMEFLLCFHNTIRHDY